MSWKWSLKLRFGKNKKAMEICGRLNFLLVCSMVFFLGETDCNTVFLMFMCMICTPAVDVSKLVPLYVCIVVWYVCSSLRGGELRGPYR